MVGEGICFEGSVVFHSFLPLEAGKLNIWLQIRIVHKILAMEPDSEIWIRTFRYKVQKVMFRRTFINRVIGLIKVRFGSLFDYFSNCFSFLPSVCNSIGEILSKFMIAFGSPRLDLGEIRWKLS